MKRMKLMLLLGLLTFGTGAWAQLSQTQTFTDVASIKFNSGIGNCQIQPASGDQVTVKVTYDDPSVDISFDQQGDRLIISDKTQRNQDINWTLQVPRGTDLDLNLGTGNLKLSGQEGNIKVNSGTGSIRIAESSGNLDLNAGTGSIWVSGGSGRFDLNSGTGGLQLSEISGSIKANTGTGHLEGTEITITGTSTFNSGTGNAHVSLNAALAGNLTLNSGTGDAILDFNGQQMNAEIVMKCSKKSGKILAPFAFDDETTTNGGKTLQKTLRQGSGARKVHISTGTGKAQLKA